MEGGLVVDADERGVELFVVGVGEVEKEAETVDEEDGGEGDGDCVRIGVCPSFDGYQGVVVRESRRYFPRPHVKKLFLLVKVVLCNVLGAKVKANSAHVDTMGVFSQPLRYLWLLWIWLTISDQPVVCPPLHSGKI